MEIIINESLHQNIGQLIQSCGGYEQFKSIIISENSRNAAEISIHKQRLNYLSFNVQPFYKRIFFRPTRVSKKSIYRPCELLLVSTTAHKSTKELAHHLPSRSYNIIQKMRYMIRSDYYKWISMVDLVEKK